MINNSLVRALKGIETTMVDFNKKFIDTEELQSEILILRKILLIPSVSSVGSHKAVILFPPILI